MQTETVECLTISNAWSGDRPIIEIAGPRKLSTTMWGLDWEEQLLNAPLTDDGITVGPSSPEEVMPFVAANFAAMFKEDPAATPFLQGRSSEARNRFYKECADFFAFKHAGELVGVSIMNPSDWSSYYIRFSAFLPAYQGRQLMQRFFPHLFRILQAAGVERLEVETSPSNLAVMHMMNRFRFNVVGTVLSERWGALIRFTKFLDEECEGVFLNQYCRGIRYQTIHRK